MTVQSSATPSTRTVLQVLPRPRLLELARSFVVPVPPDSTKEREVEALATAGHLRFRDLLGVLGREELKSACRSHGLDDSGRARAALAARLLQAHAVPPVPAVKCDPSADSR